MEENLFNSFCALGHTMIVDPTLPPNTMELQTPTQRVHIENIGPAVEKEAAD